jgi:hypothetical protein
MKITKSQFKQIIKEELQTLSEWEVDPEEEAAQEYDGLYSQIDGWTKEILDRGNIDEMRDLNEFLENLLGKLEDPYRR